MVSVMSQCLKPFSVDFLEFLMKRRQLKNLNKSANKLIKNKKINRMIKKKQTILTLIFFDKFLMRNIFLFILLVYCTMFLHFLSSLFNDSEEIYSQKVTTQMDDFKFDFALKLSNYRSLKHFICLKWILKKFSTTLHSQFDYHALPITPFNYLYFLLSKHKFTRI